MQITTQLRWLAQHPQLLHGIGRGIERETLRVTPQGVLAQTPHPTVLGKALTHDWITTDFAEALLEFITPVERNIDDLLAFLTNVHSYTAQQLKDELFWPFSMPCYVKDEQQVMVAQYGQSNIGRLKSLYRTGLKHRYGALMQLISGVHYNFSMTEDFWTAYWQADWQQPIATEQATVSVGYLRLIRNYMRFGWIIPYLFGASPAICHSFLQGKQSSLPLIKLSSGVYTMENATSLRLSDLGYTNQEQQKLAIRYNQLDEYTAAVRQATHTPSSLFASLALSTAQGHQQINGNILQIENELYAPIRPKRVTLPEERPSQALNRAGIEYIEVRSLDINPFSPIGVAKEQLIFLDIFLVWCLLAPSPLMDDEELAESRKNWSQVIYQGRDLANLHFLPAKQRSLRQVAETLFADFAQIAAIFDQQQDSIVYQQTCQHLQSWLADPQQTYSGRFLDLLTKQNFAQLGIELAQRYHADFLQHRLSSERVAQFTQAQKASIVKQQQIEQSDKMTFEQYLQQVNLADKINR